MNEELETMMKKIDLEFQEYLNNKNDINILSELELDLTKMKMMVGIERFDELNAYRRMLNRTTLLLDEKLNGGNKKND